jgi:hypothetical protein
MGSCSYAGPDGCDQADADVLCKLKTRDPGAHALDFTLVNPPDPNQPGFCCVDNGGLEVGPFPQWGVDTPVCYAEVLTPSVSVRDVVCEVP